MHDLPENSAIRNKLLFLFYFGLLFPFLDTALCNLGIPHSEFTFITLRPLWLAVMSGCISGFFFMRPAHQQKISIPCWILVCAMCWIVLRVIAERYIFYKYDSTHIWLRAFAAWFLYFTLGSLLEREELKRAVHFIAAVWITTMVLFSIIGIVAVANRFVLYTFHDATKFGSVDKRMDLAVYCVDSAQDNVLACNLALFVLFTAKKKWIRGLCICAIAIFFVAIGLADGTNAMLTLALLIAMAVFAAVTQRLSPRTLKGFCLGAAAALLVFTVCYSVNTRIIRCFDMHPTHAVHLDQLAHGQPSWEPLEEPAPSTPSAPSAPEPAQSQPNPEVTHRVINSSMHNRTQIWEQAADAILHNTDNVLLFGRTPFEADRLVQTPKLNYYVPTAHCLYLQIILEWGLPGLVMMVAFLFLFAKSALALLFAQNAPMWERLVPCLAIGCLFSELADCFSILAEGTVSIYILFLNMGLVFGLARKRKTEIVS